MKIVFILYIPTRKGFYTTYDEKKAFPTEIGPSGIMEVGIDNRSLYGDMIFLPKNFFGPQKGRRIGSFQGRTCWSWGGTWTGGIHLCKR